MIKKIYEHLYVGDIQFLHGNGQEIIANEIKVILTVSSNPLTSQSLLFGAEYKFIYMLDMENQNIFADSLLENALDIIEESLRNERTILVHCESGVSRSPTIVAAFLMKKFQWNLASSMEFLRQKHSAACPNSSFLQQLELFEQLNYSANPSIVKRSKFYRNFLATNGHLFSSNYDPTSTYTMEESRTFSSEFKYSCKRCRSALFYDFNIVNHLNAEEETGLKIFCKFQYLLTPIEWMKMDEHCGKINCPNCHLKIGNYTWQGRHCNAACANNSTFCRKFVQPWIYIQSDKVDCFKLGDQKRPISPEL